MACVNWHMVISVAIVVVVKAVGTTFFLLYLPQIFPPVFKESPNSTSTERSTPVPWTSPTTFKENSKHSTTENSRTVPPISPATSEGNFRYTTPEKTGTDCPIRWDFYMGRCYFFSTNEENWNNSQTRCSNEGTTLAIINNEGEQNFLRERAGSEVYFIGLRYQSSQKSWQWIDGSGFMVHITNDPPNFDCGTIGVSPTIDKSSCEISHRWICEKRAL
ncbi:C-type lectin domain family 5 member A [Dromiciops gliroides]|uniref:C-type lectin domain family 5 member A n=1 Tax=Dromiciops gliroides TaxID=33562 RepID=UPI001CC4758A|nr:C-type lectin domain family 5 member A [Dromiciops gliroides]